MEIAQPLCARPLRGPSSRETLWPLALASKASVYLHPCGTVLMIHHHVALPRSFQDRPVLQALQPPSPPPLCFQGEQVLKDGIGTAAEVEEDAEPVSARAFLTDPSGLLAASPLVKTLGE